MKAKDNVKWVLEAVTDSNKEWRVVIERNPFMVGRDEACELKLTDKRISRRHFEIRRGGDLIWIRDLNSTNGTFVNHKKIDQAELLEQGDTISIGKFKFCIKNVKSNYSPIADKTYLMDSMDISQNFKDLDVLESKLRDLLIHRDVNPHFQPIVKFSDMEVIGYEILGRISDESLPSNPSELLELAQSFGYDPELSDLFREVGVEIGRYLPGSPVLFVNTTPMEIFKTDDLLKSLKKIHDMAPSNRIVVEINEKAITTKNEMSRLRNGLEKLNIGLAFDDFGVGQTRLVELAKAPPDYLKFDASLIHDIHLAPKRLHQMLSTFVKAAEDLGIGTLAECVECSDEAKTCQQLGFNFAQGFFYGKPLAISEIISTHNTEN
jgi:EAL domain-containing protein (putative c-di-GMP-specific phosphodiesterase class I)